MKDRITQLWELLRTASPATRIALVTSLLALGAVAAGATWFAGQPDYVQLWSGLGAAEAAEYKSALAQAGIPFRSSPPPENGIWVDAADQARAEAQVALGGYRPSQKGILLADGGAASAFLSARSRQQMADKREWQECELQLESLAFVERATVTTSSNDYSPFGTQAPPTISVTLGLRHGVSLDDTQSRTVARLVRSRFNVPLENITVVDERGNLLHDGSEGERHPGADELFDQKRRHDADSERRANRALELALGKGMAHVTVNSEWTYDELESIVESALPESSAPYYQSTTKAATQGGASLGGGPAGVSSNIVQDFGNENAAIGAGGGAAAENREALDRAPPGPHSAHHPALGRPRRGRERHDEPGPAGGDGEGRGRLRGEARRPVRGLHDLARLSRPGRRGQPDPARGARAGRAAERLPRARHRARGRGRGRAGLRLRPHAEPQGGRRRAARRRR
jgi:flagellar biosynthesis/type III secretory pathway M-ring protein FliF/YscJ